MQFLTKYNTLLQQYPLLTKSVTGGFMFFAGDAVVQTMESQIAKKNQQSHQYDFRRLGIAWLMGNVFMMPLFHYNFTYALPWLVKRLPFDTSTPFRAAVGSVLIDQSVWACYILCHYLMIINLLESRSVQKGIDAIKNNFIKAMITNWQIWPAAQIINFWLIPRHYQVLWVNFIGFFWNIYLSYISHN
ncbi:unnamed protein product [Paramecium pentaurelia]|uniref:Uncharacterized protein n=1 Tax=Paramecium pentaurelia TaxID=43138 RepID=A0A8S1WVB3_9CILI|nr:unnamed protein product [Paramecium pentaurelia]